MTTPLITIIIPCFKQAKYLEEALNSVMNQTYTHWECIIVNDGSPDQTENIAEKWIEKDRRFRYFFQENSGLSSARNLGIEKAAGSYFQFLDSDDLLAPSKLEKSLREIQNRNGSRNVVITNFNMFTDNIKDLRAPFCHLSKDLFSFKSILLKWDSVFSIPIHCGLFSKNLFLDFRFPEELKAKEDWVMWLHVFQKKPEVSFIDKPLVYYRSHEQSMTQNDAFMEENYFKALVYIKELVSKEDIFNYCFAELQRKNQTIAQLKNSIENYQNTRTYRSSQRIQKMWLGNWLIKLAKYI